MAVGVFDPRDEQAIEPDLRLGEARYSFADELLVRLSDVSGRMAGWRAA
jgi:hypothetical protein